MKVFKGGQELRDYILEGLKQEPHDYEITRDNGPLIRIRDGYFLGRTSCAGRSWYFERALWKTKDGRFVCFRSDNDQDTAQVVGDLQEVYQFLGYGELAKKLYQEAGIAPVEEV